jgi:hypothetical protein
MKWTIVSPYSQDTVAALISALEKDAICNEALVVLSAGGCEKEVAAAKVRAVQVESS